MIISENRFCTKFSKNVIIKGQFGLVLNCSEASKECGNCINNGLMTEIMKNVLVNEHPESFGGDNFHKGLLDSGWKDYSALTDSSSGCYIATACYGSYEHPKVIILRNFCDTTLQRYKLGNFLIKIYYHFSPWFASRLNYNSKLTIFIREHFIDKLIYITRNNFIVTKYKTSL